MKYHQTLNLFLLANILSTQVKAQDKPQEKSTLPYINSLELIRKGVTAHDEGDYKKALSYYGQVPAGDTNYALALYESALTNLNDSNYEKSIEQAKQVLALQYSDRRQTLLNLGTALDEAGKTDEAIKVYDSAARLYPQDNRPYYELAIIKYKAKDYDGAAVLLQKSLLINPLHFRSHFILGSIYAFQGKLTESIMALNASLLCTTDLDQARKPISVLDAIANQTEEVTQMYNDRSAEGRDPAFDEIDEIVHAKLALQKGFQLRSEIDDAIFRQLQVVMEKLEYDKNDTGFDMQFYVPLYTRIYKENQFEPFILLLFSDYGIKSIDKVNSSRKGKEKLETIRSIVYPYLNKIRATRVLDNGERQKATERYHYSDEDATLAIGVLADKEKGVFAAGPVQFYENQALLAEGNYDAAGKKDGVWEYYYSNGKPRRKEEYKNGTAKGEAVVWYENGVVKKEVKFNQEGTDSEIREYEYNGMLSDAGVLKGKDEYEYTYYYPSGNVRKKLTFVNDKLKDGKSVVYYDNGQKQKELVYKNEEINGPYVSYFDNGQIDETFSYQDGQITGPYKSYTENGKVLIEGTFVNGKRQGESVEYREDGSLFCRKNFNKGKADGDVHYYNKAGKEYGIVTYKNDRIIHSRFFRPDGTEIVDKDVADGYVSIYNEYGNLLRKLKVDKDGNLQGKASYYYAWGGLKEETNFKDDNKNGKSTFYYQNGTVSSVRQYRNDTTDGYYQYFNDIGQQLTAGWLKDEQSQGAWQNYHENGKVSRDFYMVNDELNGPEKNYEKDGRITHINHFDRGMIVGLTQYDTTGKVLQDVAFDKGTGRYRMLHFNGNPGLECDLKFGKLNGAYTIRGGNKALIEKGVYVNGKNDGEVETFFANGKRRVKGMYAGGKKEKTWTYYGWDGAVESVTEYRKGDQDGQDSTFSGGRLISVATYDRDDLNGAYTIYGEAKNVAGVLYYDHGTLTGYSYEGKDGKLMPVIPVQKATAHVQTYYANGNKAIDWSYANNAPDGKLMHYFSTGQLAQEVNYVKGVRQGAYAQFNPDGSPLYEYNYKDDQKEGVGKIYNNKGRLVLVANYSGGDMNGKVQFTDEQGKTQNYWYYYGSIE